MKKVFLTLISTFMAICIGYAQNMNGLIAQPTHIIGKRINASGEVTKIVESDFTYYEDGKPHTFTIPDYELSTNYRLRKTTLVKKIHGTVPDTPFSKKSSNTLTRTVR